MLIPFIVKVAVLGSPLSLSLYIYINDKLLQNDNIINEQRHY